MMDARNGKKRGKRGGINIYCRTSVLAAAGAAAAAAAYPTSPFFR